MPTVCITKYVDYYNTKYEAYCLYHTKYEAYILYHTKYEAYFL